MSVSVHYSKLKAAMRFIEGKGYQVAYVALRGSQNYRLDTETSDFDYVAVVIPRFTDLVAKCWIQTKEYEYDGGHIDMYDIREYFACICKMNPSILETLVTPHHIDMTPNKMFCAAYVHVVQAIPYRSGDLALAIKGTYQRYLKLYGRGAGDRCGKSVAHMIRLVAYMENLCENKIFDPDFSGRKDAYKTALLYKRASDDGVFSAKLTDYVDWLTNRINDLCNKEVLICNLNSEKDKADEHRQKVSDMVSALIKEHIKKEMRDEDEGNQA